MQREVHVISDSQSDLLEFMSCNPKIDRNRDNQLGNGSTEHTRAYKIIISIGLYQARPPL